MKHCTLFPLLWILLIHSLIAVCFLSYRLHSRYTQSEVISQLTSHCAQGCGAQGVGALGVRLEGIGPQINCECEKRSIPPVKKTVKKKKGKKKK